MNDMVRVRRSLLQQVVTLVARGAITWDSDEDADEIADVVMELRLNMDGRETCDICFGDGFVISPVGPGGGLLGCGGCDGGGTIKRRG